MKDLLGGKSQCIALALLKDEGELDNRGYRNATGVGSRVATTELQDLVAREVITQIGTRRWARYRLAPRPLAQTDQPARADRRPSILQALGDQTLSRGELAARTGLSDQTVRRWLRIMRDEGDIEIIGDCDNPKSMHVKYRRDRQDTLFTPPAP